MSYQKPEVVVCASGPKLKKPLKRVVQKYETTWMTNPEQRKLFASVVQN